MGAKEGKNMNENAETMVDDDTSERAVDALERMGDAGSQLDVIIHQKPTTMIEVVYWTTNVERGKAALQTLIDFNRRGGKAK